MLRPKKVIPSLAVATLALTGVGCGGDGSGTGGSGAGNGNGSDLSEAVTAFCMHVVGCFTDYALSDCTGYYSDIIPGNIGDACENAIISYFDCGSNLSCEELSEYSNSCDPQWETLMAACDV